MSANDKYIALLKQHRRKFHTMSGALQLLSNQFESGLTLAGGMLPSRFATGSPAKALWMTVEFGVSNPDQIPKRDRMYPIAIRYCDQKTVFRNHGIFYNKGWEAATQGWLTPSGEMGLYRHMQIDHLVFSTNNDAKLARSLHRAMSKLVKVVTIYPDQGKLIFLEPNECREWPLDACPRGEGHLTAKPFLAWLASFEKAGLRCQFYVGRDYSIEEDARLYAAFTKSANAQDIVNVCKVAENLHDARIRDAIRDSLVGGAPKTSSGFKWYFDGDIGQAVWRGETLRSFNKTQATVVDLLYNRVKEGHPLVGSNTILQLVKDKCSWDYRKVRDIFKKHPAWGKLIITENPTKGPYRLNI